MKDGIPARWFAAAIAFALIAAILTPVPLLAGGQQIKFTTFTVPASAGGVLGVEDVNNPGAIVGYYIVSSGTFGFLRTPSGVLAPVADPLNTSTPPNTRAFGVNQSGTITGQFYNTKPAEYDGFFRFPNGIYKTYVFPGLPTGSVTGLIKANDVGGLCGWVVPNTTPASQEQAFVSLPSPRGAENTIISLPNSVCYDINDAGIAAGDYVDNAGVTHGFIRTAEGQIISPIDAPGASTTPGSVPCFSGPAGAGTAAGTAVLGINNQGDISGHFFDTSYNEHGFIWLNEGGQFTRFIQIDVPGAFQTSGAGLNDFPEIVGHYVVDTSCNEAGYTAKLQ
jgi:hypothetical protein